ncbi:MAG: hypothetical protein H7Y22_03030 [Gemmatimonadaceae bacterium]|nr:hypothetical protein [Gloeobacterales cyanobacterium ES-bin-141]
MNIQVTCQFDCDVPAARHCRHDAGFSATRLRMEETSFEVLAWTGAVAELPEETLQTVFHLQRQLLAAVHLDRQTEFRLLEAVGEVEATIAALTALSNIMHTTSARYQRLVTLLLRISEAQPQANFDTLSMMLDTIVAVQSSLPALLRSLEEIRQDWRL